MTLSSNGPPALASYGSSLSLLLCSLLHFVGGGAQQQMGTDRLCFFFFFLLNKQSASGEVENQSAVKMVGNIDKRLRGMEKPILPLSVEGQVHLQIQEATSQDNLCQAQDPSHRKKKGGGAQC